MVFEKVGRALAEFGALFSDCCTELENNANAQPLAYTVYLDLNWLLVGWDNMQCRDTTQDSSCQS